MKRRDFLRYSAVGAAAGLAGCQDGNMSLFSQASKRPRLGANERIRVAFIGAGGRARQLMTGEKLTDHADIVAIADCFKQRTEEARNMLPEQDRGRINTYQDFREMLDKEQVHACFVPTTTHARAWVCMQLMQRGLDIYAEKPVALTVAEGRALVKAARKCKTVFQVGTQQRSIPINAWASKLVREGAIGKVHTVQTYNYEAPFIWKDQPGQPVPETLDWDMWLNQGVFRPYHPDLQYKWGIWRDYDGGGQSWGVTGWGTHALDQVQCALGTDDTVPVEVWLEGAGPDTPIEERQKAKATMKYKNGTLLKLHGPKRHYEDLGAIFVGDKGQIEIRRGSLVADPVGRIKGAPPDVAAAAPGESVWHLANFFECMRTRKKPNADIEIAHRSTIICNLVNICRDMGRKLTFDPKSERFVGDAEANKHPYVIRERRKGYELAEV